ncbi:MAG: alpha/beta fold hydrolase [Alphaproteobacteria bacterium]|nr:alpha/beta fold hydrolase [Alphaproteobacteria bacterium]
MNGGLFTRVDGEGDKPWIVLSNSLGSTHRMWDGQMDLLTCKYRVLRYDHRGHGESAVSEGEVSWSDLIGDVIAIMDDHGIDRADFMGLSMGLMTGLGLGIHHGGRFGKLVLCDGRADAPDLFQKMWDQRISAIEAGGIEAIADGALAIWLSEDWRTANPDRVTELRTMMVTTPAEGYMACCRCLKTLDYLKDCGDIRNDVLCITGGKDMGAPPDVVKGIAAAIPGARFVEIAGSHHLSNIDGEAAFNAAVASFLEIV